MHDGKSKLEKSVGELECLGKYIENAAATRKGKLRGWEIDFD